MGSGESGEKVGDCSLVAKESLGRDVRFAIRVKGKGRLCFHSRPLFNPATSYSPTQFPVQYNRPCEA